MQTIAIVTDSPYKKNRRSSVGTILKENLEEVFGHILQIENYYIDRLGHNEKIDADLVLVMAGSRAIKVKSYVTRPSRIIVATRTFLKSSVNPLFELPAGTDVLMVNDDIETVLDSVNSLYHIGVKHVNLIPYEIGKEYRSIEIAVSPSEPEFVPDYIPKVIDIGSRVLDLPTMLTIIDSLTLKDRETHQRLYHYYQKIFSPSKAITKQYRDYLERTEELDYVLDLSKDGILLTDMQGKILVANRRFRELFSQDDDVIGQKLHDCLPEIEATKYYNDREQDDLLTFRKRKLSLQKKSVVHFDGNARLYFDFQEITYIKKLEQNLSQKLRKKGQVARYTFDDMLTETPSIRGLIDRCKKVAATDLTLLITGESGTGKEVLAQAIHNASDRNAQPFIAINTSAIPEHLLESELFGYSEGTFTGALREGKRGLFEMANHGTLFLDEIGDMPAHMQGKLLRVLQERQIAPLGSDTIVDIDVRIIAATHHDPRGMIDSGAFRTDLFYRLNVFPIHLPPLRERKDDLMHLMEAFTDHRFIFSQDCIDGFCRYSWPGNVRELNNVARYLMTVHEKSHVEIRDLPDYLIDLFDAPSTSPLSETKDVLALLGDADLSLTILQTIAELHGLGLTAGRQHLIDALQKKGILLTDSPLRRHLDYLARTGLVEKRKGRGGSALTKKGQMIVANASKG
jgi:transcriptional regulator with PAS, ATPase and Fis domain